MTRQDIAGDSIASSSARDATTPMRELDGSRILRAGLTGAAVAAAGNLVVFALAHAAGASLVAQFDPKAPATALPVAMVIIASVVPAVAATGVLALMNRLLRRPSRAFAMIAIAFGLFSMGGPATLAGADAATKATLGAMHVVAALAIAVALLRGARRRA